MISTHAEIIILKTMEMSSNGQNGVRIDCWEISISNGAVGWFVPDEVIPEHCAVKFKFFQDLPSEPKDLCYPLPRPQFLSRLCFLGVEGFESFTLSLDGQLWIIIGVERSKLHVQLVVRRERQIKLF